MSQLKYNSETSFDYLFCLTGIDYEKTLGIIYHLESTAHRHQLVVKVQTEDRENPTFDSVWDIWRTAEFHEREVFDFFGIKFFCITVFYVFLSVVFSNVFMTIHTDIQGRNT